jgi:hypothetical protein
MQRQLNDPVRFRARILNKENIGQSSHELVKQWKRDHPDDLVKD